MKFNIAKAILYSSTISLAILCIFAIIDNFNLVIHENVSSTISCDVKESFNANTGEVIKAQNCDSYNPQVVFYASIFLLIFDAIVFKHFHSVINKNEKTRDEFLDFYNTKTLNKNGINK